MGVGGESVNELELGMALLSVLGVVLSSFEVICWFNGFLSLMTRDTYKKASPKVSAGIVVG